MGGKQNNNNFFIDRWRSLGYAFKGCWMLISKETAIQVHAFFGLIFIASGFLFEISTLEWMIQLLAIGLILSVEGVNTTIEELCDFIHESHHEKIGKIKDISAGAVTFAALGGYLVLCLLYINKILF